MQEEWKDVVGYEEYFMVSDHGKVYSKRTNKVLKSTVSKTGYYTIATKIGGRGGKNLCFKIHRLVASAFLNEPKQHHKEFAEDSFYNVVYVNHIDGNKLNNHISNLEWCTNNENIQHASINGLLYSGRSPLRKLTDLEIEYIKSIYIPRDRVFGLRALGRKFKISHSKLSRIINGKAYLK